MVTSYFNRAVMSTTTTGTGTITLSTSAVSGFQSFENAGVSTNSNGAEIYYVITEGTDSTNWELGGGTYISSAKSLSRRVKESSNSDAAIVLAGSAEVALQVDAEDIDPEVDWGAITDTALVKEDYGSV